MSSSVVRRVVSLMVALTAGLALAATGTASAATGGAHPSWGPGSDRGSCAAGQATGHGATVLNSFAFTACGHSPDPHDVTGYFSAMGTPPANLLIAPQGPVTCAAFHGDEVAFLYPLAAGSKPAFPPNATAILIYARAGGPGIGRIGFTPPLPTATFNNNCGLSTPQALGAKTTALPITTGTITVTGPATS